MNNERIQEIKKKIERGMRLYESGLLPKQYEQNVLDDAYLLSEVERLQEENKAMKEALEWYANDKNYKLGHQTVLGERARTALSHLKGE